MTKRRWERIKFVLPIGLLTLLLVSCGRHEHQDVGVPIAELCPAIVKDSYFSEEMLTGIDHTEMEREFSDYTWAAYTLTEMDEPSLSCGKSHEVDVLRVLWVQAFEDPVVIRVSRAGRMISLESVTSEDGRALRTKKKISRRDWSDLLLALERMDFWETSPVADVDVAADGDVWVIEARVNGRYHFVSRWTGFHGTRETGQSFLELAGVVE